MDKEELLMAGMLFGSLVLAAFITVGIWPSIRRKLEKTRRGRLFLSAGRTGRKPVFLVHTLVWLAVMLIMLLIWALVTS